MHGVLLWSDRHTQTSALINWQDRRASETGFLPRVQSRCEDVGLRDGYGSVSLAWLAEYDPELLRTFNRASTIHDFLVARCCGLTFPLTDATDAASWGMFRVIERCWDEAKIAKARLDPQFFPRVHASGSIAGQLSGPQAEVWGVPKGIPVHVAIGDNQASLYATLEDAETDVALTLGTGGQLSIPLKNPIPEALLYGETYEIRPYVGEQSIAVAASLCGGRAMQWLAESLQTFAEQLGQRSVSITSVYEAIDRAAETVQRPSLAIQSSFLGERFDPNRRGSITGIDLANFSIAQLGNALMRDMVENLKRMLPADLWRGKQRVVGSGNGIRKLRSMQRIGAEVLGLPLVLSAEREEAATGAALLAADSR
jgi:sedoheptulokinase